MTERPSHLRIRGGRSPQSAVGASLVARRVTAPRVGFEASVDHRPTAFQHASGLTAYDNARTWYFLHVTADDDGRNVLRLAGCDRGALTLHPDVVGLDGDGPVRLGLDLDGGRLTFRHHGPGGRAACPRAGPVPRRRDPTRGPVSPPRPRAPA
ncbi:hypothetical protein [Cellulomonas sp. NS3]|uniref:beta-xylosidase family glycoside hydrolase n=1 Tax=Cellulomonas sp. NS3 TaxID=2973977 RepID=UPI0037BFF80F